MHMTNQEIMDLVACFDRSTVKTMKLTWEGFALELTRDAFREAGIDLEGSIEIEAYPESCGVLVFAHVHRPERVWFSFGRLEDLAAAARSLPPVGGSDAHDAREVGNAYTELTAEALTVPALRAALAAGRSRAVLARNTAHVRKGLSQWTKALRRGGVLRLGKAAAYVCWCAWLDVTDRR